MPENSKTAETAAQFQTRAAKVLVSIGKAAKLRNSRVASWISECGIAAELSDTSDSIKVDAVAEPQPTDYVGSGMARQDLTADAQAKLDRRELHSARNHVYRTIRRLADYGYMSNDLAENACAELGLPLPEKYTEVSVSVAGVSEKDSYGDYRPMSFSLPGEHGSDAIRERFASVANDPVSNAIRTAFPEADGLPNPVTVHRCRTHTTWPSFPEFSE